MYIIVNFDCKFKGNQKNIEKILKADRQNPNKAFIYDERESIQAILDDVKMILGKISSPENTKDPGKLRKIAETMNPSRLFKK